MGSPPPGLHASVVVVAVTLLAGLALASCAEDADDGQETAPATTRPVATPPVPSLPPVTAPVTTTRLAGVEVFPAPGRLHVQGDVPYAQSPPVGGDHNPVWQNCGFYSRPVEPERAVHALEHGAVWITYRPGLAAEEVDVLRRLAKSRSKILVSPWGDTSLPSPVVASAWGVQLKLASASDPALATFVGVYVGGGQAPEPRGPCSGAFGSPE